MAAPSRRGRTTADIWPGFVDALATLLMVIIFLLMLFVVAQFYLADVLSGKDEALERLNREVAQLSDLLALEEQANQDLQATVASLSGELQSTLSERYKLGAEVRSLRDLTDTMTARLADLQDTADATEAERSRLAAALAESEVLLLAREEDLARRDAELESTRAELDERLAALAEAQKRIQVTEEALKRTELAYADSAAALALRMKELEEANKTIDTDAETIEIQLRKLAELEQDIVAMEAYRAQLEEELKTLMVKTKAGEEDLSRERDISMAAKAQLAMLNNQLAELRAQISALNEALEASEDRDEEQKAQIVDLGKRLNAALAAKVQELARYRSEFFGRLRDVLGDRKDIRIVGDRFVFQSELLFASGDAKLGRTGRERMAALARTLRDISKSIPSEINWVLRVDGHTDRDPIHTDKFPTNWELSTARATSVVRFLQQQGIPPERLAATGFGEYQPLDPGETPDAYRRNRRIELKFDQR
jgi:chemotaxis protein MotB